MAELSFAFPETLLCSRPDGAIDGSEQRPWAERAELEIRRLCYDI